MPTDSRTLFAPETDAEALAACRIESASDTLALVRGLSGSGSLVACHVGGGQDDCFITTVVGYDPASRLVTLDGPPASQRCQADRATVVGFVDRIKVQLVIERLAPRDDDGDRLAVGRLLSLHRLQRREAFRVRPPQSPPPRALLARAGDDPTEFAVIDLSATGLALRVPAGHALPEPGDRLANAWVELAEFPPMQVDLVVRNVAPATAERAEARVGCQLVNLDPTTSRALQRYVIDVERRIVGARR